MNVRSAFALASLALLTLPHRVLADSNCSPNATLKQFYTNDKQFTEKSLLPRGWKIYQKARADLTGDGIPDLALIVDEVAKKPVEGPNDDDEELPRALVFLSGIDSKSYRLAGYGPCALFRAYDSFLVETKLAVQKNVLVIDQSTMMSMGGWGASEVTTRWRIDDGKPRLIGLTSHEMMRNSGDGSKSDQNFLTGTTELSTFNEFDPKVTPQKRTVHSKPRSIALETMSLESELTRAGTELYNTFHPESAASDEGAPE